MDYETGWAFGDACCEEADLALEFFLSEALLLIRRHASVSAAARLMCVAEAGLRGFLDGAAGHSLFGDEPFPGTDGRTTQPAGAPKPGRRPACARVAR